MRWLSPPDSVPERASQRQIVEPDIDQERQAFSDFLQDAFGDLVALGIELCRQSLEPVMRSAHGKFGDFADMLHVDLHREGFRFQPVAVAGRAGLGCHKAGDFLARPFALGLAIAPLEIADHAFEGLVDVIGAHSVVIGRSARIPRPSRRGGAFGFPSAGSRRPYRGGT